MNANKYTLPYICLCKYSRGPCKSLTHLQAAAFSFLVRTLPGLMTGGIMTSQKDISISKLTPKVLQGPAH